jgi:acylphosphatase
VGSTLVSSTVGAERRELHYSGRVQGVGFRYTARRIATGYGVSGFVRNLSDGRVQVVVEGIRGELDRYLSALGAEMKRNITGAETLTSPATGEFDGFEVRF